MYQIDENTAASVPIKFFFKNGARKTELFGVNKGFVSFGFFFNNLKFSSSVFALAAP